MRVSLLLCAVAVLLAGCGAAAPPAASNAAGAAAESTAVLSPYKPTATFQEIMDSEVDFSSDYIWNAVSTTSDAKGVHEHQPRTDEEWHEFRRRAIILAEAANLIAVPGRRAANGDRTVETRDPLPVADIQKRLDSQHEQLVGFADGMRDVAVKLVQAADRKDVALVTDLGGTLDEVCEACHLVFWYPEDAQQYKSAEAAPGTAGK